MDKFLECDTCAFRDEPGYVCDACEDADQWEEGEEYRLVAAPIHFVQRESYELSSNGQV